MIRLSIDDACASDVRVAELCEKYEVPAIFYWPVEWHSLAYDNGYKPLDYNEALTISRNFEIGSHTITHRHLTNLTPLDANKEIIGSKFMLERMFNKQIRKFCPPRGYTNKELTEVTLQFYETQRLTRDKDLVHIHPNSGANDNRPWREVYNLKAQQYEDVELWCHSWELNKYNLWNELEDFLRESTRSELRTK